MAWAGCTKRQRTDQGLGGSSSIRKRGRRRILRGADEIDVAVAVDRDRRESFRTGAAEVGGKIELGVDDQFTAAVIGADLETDAVGGAQNEASRDWLLASAVALVDVGCLQAQAAIVLASENQVTATQFQFGCAVKLQLGLRRVSAGSNTEVIFEMAAVPVEDEIDSRIDASVVDRGKLRNAAMPLLRVVADEVVGLPRQQIASGGDSGRVGADQIHAHDLFVPVFLTFTRVFFTGSRRR